MTADPIQDRARLMLHAALDGELDAAGMLDFERELAANPALAAEYERQRALSAALRAHSTRERAPESLRQAIVAMGGELASKPKLAAAPSRWRDPGFRRALAACIVVGCIGSVIGAGGMSYFTAREPMRVASLLIDDHRRALLAREPVDVVSTDRHTVKPWFDGRLALSPPVVDLAAQGIVMLGGRADVIDGTPAPTIVYRLREHLISLTALPLARGPTPSRAPIAIDGYAVVTWSDATFNYWAVSDLPRADLDAFAAAFRARAAAQDEAH